MDSGWGRGQTENYWLEVSHMIWSPYQVYPDLWSPTPPRHCGLHIECCSCWTGWWCIFCGYWQTFVTTKWLCLVQNEPPKWSWSYTLIRWTSCSRQATVFQKLQKRNAQTYIAIVCVVEKDIFSLRAKNIVFCTCLHIHVSLCPSNKIKSITPLSAQISASKFQNWSRIPLKN